MYAIGDYVTHTSKYHPPVYRVIRQVNETTVEVEYIGDVVGGKLGNFARERNRTYRLVEDLTPYT